ncbi:MAG TPA: amidophosphoribosyltransferase [Candidatus Hydrogenedens sp.]|nr:amidophosphoribosyltransferase [Candidatus Hydrogenedens sp.]
MLELDKIREECGVFGIYNHKSAPNWIYLGLYALQHRGQEGAGIVCSDGTTLTAHRGVGLVNDVFPAHKLARVQGFMGIGHVRYSTFGTSNLRNVQPFLVNYIHGSVAVCHNGNLVNGAYLRHDLEQKGAIFQSTSDTEVIIHLIARSNADTFLDAVIDALKKVKGAFSVLIMNHNEMIAARDPFGFRPLWMGKKGRGYVFASETCALDLVGAKWLREIEPGEVVHIKDKEIKSVFPFKKVVPKQCIFEYIYVARPDSFIFGKSVDLIRKEFGRALARIAPVEADFVMAVPDSSNPAALGYAHESGLPFDMGFIRNHYVGRTFIEPDQKMRDFGVKIKLNPSRDTVKGKRIVLVDDSIVRGTTARKIIKMLRRCKVKEIHYRVASPPIINSCYYGIDTPVREKLIAYKMIKKDQEIDVEKIRQYLGVDTLAYLTIPAMLEATFSDKERFCTACFDNNYPTPTPHDFYLPPRNHNVIKDTNLDEVRHGR